MSRLRLVLSRRQGRVSRVRGRLLVRVRTRLRCGRLRARRGRSRLHLGGLRSLCRHLLGCLSQDRPRRLSLRLVVLWFLSLNRPRRLGRHRRRRLLRSLFLIRFRRWILMRLCRRRGCARVVLMVLLPTVGMCAVTRLGQSLIVVFKGFSVLVWGRGYAGFGLHE